MNSVICVQRSESTAAASLRVNASLKVDALQRDTLNPVISKG